MYSLVTKTFNREATLSVYVCVCFHVRICFDYIHHVYKYVHTLKDERISSFTLNLIEGRCNW